MVDVLLGEIFYSVQFWGFFLLHTYWGYDTQCFVYTQNLMGCTCNHEINGENVSRRLHLSALGLYVPSRVQPR